MIILPCIFQGCYAGLTLSNELYRKGDGELYIIALLSEESIGTDGRQEGRRTLRRQKAAMR